MNDEDTVFLVTAFNLSHFVFQWIYKIWGWNFLIHLSALYRSGH